jgi:hypothetical protein
LSDDWFALSPEEASLILFKRCVGLLLDKQSQHQMMSDLTIRILTQRLYGDYRQFHNTQEFKRAEKHVYYFKNTGLGKELF